MMTIEETFYVIRLDQNDGVGVYFHFGYGTGWWYIGCSVDLMHCKRWKTLKGAMRAIDKLEYSRSEAAKEDPDYHERNIYIGKCSDYEVNIDRVTFRVKKVTITTKIEEMIC